MGKTPSANGSRVPVCPTRFIPASRLTLATAAKEVIPFGNHIKNRALRLVYILTFVNEDIVKTFGNCLCGI